MNRKTRHTYIPPDSADSGIEAAKIAVDNIDPPAKDMIIRVEYNDETNESWDVRIEYTE